MQLQLQDFPTLVRNQAAAVAASCSTLLDVSVGSVLRALLEANASVALWVQWLVMEVLALTRAATSSGADLDSWVADFGLARLPAVPASGMVQFSRSTAGLAATIPVGALIRTGAGLGAAVFQVVADPTQAGWTGSGYSLPAAGLSVSAPVQAVTAGQAGNVQAGTLVLLSSAIPGVDAVSNAVAMSGGLDAEADAALRGRFSGFLDSRTRATGQAVSFAVQSVQQGLLFKVAEQVDASGAFRAGHFTVVVDDGSGAPSDALVQAVGAAIESVRAVGSTFSVIRPQIVPVAIALRISGTAQSPGLVQAGVGAWLGQLPFGTTVILSKVVQIAHDSDPYVVRVDELTIDGVAADLTVGAFARPVLGSMTFLS